MDQHTLLANGDKFWGKVRPFLGLDACWEWTGKRKRGYGEWRIEINGKCQYQFAHRVAYRMLIGEIPDDRQLDHLCRNRACVNPDHLELVSARENIRRGRSGKSRRFVDGVLACRNGHQLTEENARQRGDHIMCIECARARNARSRARRR